MTCLLDNTKFILRALVVSYGEPISVDQLNRDYKSREGREIPVQQLGYHSLIDFLLSIPEVVTYNSHTRKVTPVVADNAKNKHILDLVQETKANQKQKSKRGNRSSAHNGNHYNIDNSARYPQQQQLQHHYQHQQNVLHSSLNRSLFNLTQHPLQPHQPGNLLAPPNTLLPLPQNSLLGIPPIVTTPYLFNGNGLIYGSNVPSMHTTHYTNLSLNEKQPSKPQNLVPSRKSIESKRDRSDSGGSTEDALPPIDDDDPIRFIGTKTMNSEYGTEILPAIRPTTFTKEKHTAQICVTEVTQLPYFYFQFSDTRNKMMRLQIELNLIYDVHHAERSDYIQLSHIEVGAVCAAYYAAKWSRAEVLQLPDEDERVQVLFVDYGTIDYVPSGRLRYLRKEQCVMPRLCHRGALAFVNNRSERNVIKQFCGLAGNKTLVAVFSHIDENETTFMTLINTSSPSEDIIVNKILMETNV